MYKNIVTLLLIASFSFSVYYYQPAINSETVTSIIPTDDSIKLTPISETQSAWILLAGDVEHHNDTEAMRNGCNKTYEILREKGFPQEKIFYMGPEVSSSQPYVNTSATVVNLKWAIEEWAPLHVNSSQSLGLYFQSHGDINALGVMVADVLWANNVSSFLNNFEATTGCKRIIVVIEGCRSGSFINDLSKDNRIIITSTSTYKGAAFNADRTWGAFSESFWSSIAACSSIGDAFDNGVDHIRALGCNQSPQLDDNHDGTGTTPYPNNDLPTGGEGFDALETRIWAKPITCPPQIKIMQVPLHFYEVYDPFTSSAAIEVEIENPILIEKVFARFTPVGWEAYDPENGYMYPIVDDAVRSIELESPTMDGVYIGDIAFDGLALGASFEINILAYDTKGHVADVVTTQLTFNADGVAPLDTTLPSVYIVNPDSDDIVKDTVEVTVRGNDNQKLENIDLYLDGALVESISMPNYYPYPELIYECDTKAYPEGVHNFTAVAFDHQGLTNQSTILITFRNLDPQATNGYTIAFIWSGIVLITAFVQFRKRNLKRKNYPNNR